MSAPEKGIRLRIRDVLVGFRKTPGALEAATDNVVAAIDAYVKSQTAAATSVQKQMVDLCNATARRVKELLEANNRYQAEGRAARLDRARLLEVLKPFARSSIDVSGTAAIGVTAEEISAARTAFEEISSPAAEAEPAPPPRVY